MYVQIIILEFLILQDISYWRTKNNVVALIYMSSFL